MADELERDVIDALGKGRKIDAIKLLREHRGLGLKQAKGIVDNYIVENPGSVPAKGKASSVGGFMFFVVLCFVVYLLYDFAG